jgi:hypothetical protein
VSSRRRSLAGTTQHQPSPTDALQLPQTLGGMLQGKANNRKMNGGWVAATWFVAACNDLMRQVMSARLSRTQGACECDIGSL